MLILSLRVTAIRPRRHQLLDRLQGPRERAPVRVAFRLFRDSRGQTFNDRILSIVRTREPVLYAVECAASLAFHLDCSRETVDDQRLSQVRNAELLAEFEAILLELRRRLDSYLELSPNDIIAADEGFNLAGQIQPTLSELAEHALEVRERLLELQRARQ